MKKFGILVNVVIDVSVMIFEIVVNVKYVAKCCKCCKIQFVGHVCPMGALVVYDLKFEGPLGVVVW